MSELFSSSSLLYSYNFNVLFALIPWVNMLTHLVFAVTPSHSLSVFPIHVPSLSLRFILLSSRSLYPLILSFLSISLHLSSSLSSSFSLSISLSFSFSLFFFPSLLPPLLLSPSLTLPIFLGQSSWTRTHWCHYQTPETPSQSLNWRKHWSNPRSKTRNIAGELFNKFMIQKIINYRKK